MKFHCGTNQFLRRDPVAIKSNESPNTQPTRDRKPSSPSAPKINNACWAPQGKQRPQIDLRRFGCPSNEMIVECLVVEGLGHLNGRGMLKTGSASAAGSEIHMLLACRLMRAVNANRPSTSDSAIGNLGAVRQALDFKLIGQ